MKTLAYLLFIYLKGASSLKLPDRFGRNLEPEGLRETVPKVYFFLYSFKQQYLLHMMLELFLIKNHKLARHNNKLEHDMQ